MIFDKHYTSIEMAWCKIWRLSRSSSEDIFNWQLFRCHSFKVINCSLVEKDFLLWQISTTRGWWYRWPLQHFLRYESLPMCTIRLGKYFSFNLNQINIFHYWNIRSEFRGSCARVWQHQSYYENALSSTLLMYSTLIASVDFYLFCNGTVICKYDPFWGPWRVYDALVSVKPWLGLFLFMFSVVCNNVWVRKCTVICIHPILFR